MSKESIVYEFATAQTDIADLFVIDARSVVDSRGTVRELYRSSAYKPTLAGQQDGWRQINLTRTHRGAVRGLHGEEMSKLVTVAIGAAFGVYVDTRLDSPTVGEVVTVHLEPGRQVFVPRGVCNGFQAIGEDDTEYLYFFDQEWTPGMPGVALTPLDPALGIEWPIALIGTDREQISEKDATAPPLAAILAR